MIMTLLGSASFLAILGVPLAVALGLAALVALSIFLPHIPTEIVAQRMISSVDKFPLVAVPLFILAGELMNSGGITARLIALSKALVGWIKGGLGLVNVATSVFFAGISGSSTADAAGIGRVLIPAMKKASVLKIKAAFLTKAGFR
ncbi:TRAP transporter large permease subunit [Thiosulfatihalobacter marinus]|uniref:TRAP transporter large permease subunit n=1 Tax=Thiosulfatihalobacter marinus TaxID=2792481 RepID=UPI0018D8C091|nr:TRAP transporter large permease subunit [Thiosulfatihalobacter marinus]